MSVFDHRGAVSASPSWRCPHCRTLQPGSPRCRACARSAATCSTCHLFRASVAADLGYCAADRSRAPLGGDEERACWDATTVPRAAAVGLFSDTELAPLVLAEPADIAEGPALTPPADEAPGGAWHAATPPGRLVDAPHVAPGRRLMSELERRSRRSREG